jgi:hypothetical protein
MKGKSGAFRIAESARERRSPLSSEADDDPMATADSMASASAPESAFHDGNMGRTHSTASSDAALHRLVLQLNAVCKSATLRFALSIGELVIHDLYGGNLELWRSRDPYKQHSMRKLARHPDLAMHPSMLYRSVAIYEVSERLGIRSWSHVSSTHIRIVLPLVQEEQTRLLIETATHRWSTARLEREAAPLLATTSARGSAGGGRKRCSELHGAARKLHMCLSALEKLIPDERGEAVIVGYSPESVRSFAAALRRTAEQCTILEHRLETHLAK